MLIGHHSQAVALSARLHDTRAVVLMPEDAPASKVAATEGYGAEVLRFDRYLHDREEITAETAARLGLHVLHAYDDPFVIAGQGTVALELSRRSAHPTSSSSVSAAAASWPGARLPPGRGARVPHRRRRAHGRPAGRRPARRASPSPRP